jgi:hypothetical protein
VVRVGPTGLPARLERRLLAEANEVLDHPEGGSTPSGVTPPGLLKLRPRNAPGSWPGRRPA